MKRFSKSIISIALSLLILSSSITAFAGNQFGFDVSHNNSSVDFVQQAEDGSSFVMIRLGNFTYLDKEFWSNVEKACKAGLEFGVYMYSAAFSVDEAKIEANFVIDTLKQMPEEYKKHFTLPVAYDMEAKGLMDFSKTQLTNQVVTFSEIMIKNGYVPMVYANVDWFTNRLDIKAFKSKGYKIWLANWTANPDFSSKKQVGSTGVYADMWQYQGGANHPSGLDQNVVYDVNSLKHLYRTTVTKATTSKDGKSVNACAVCKRVASSAVIPKASSINLSATSYTYDGKIKTPSVTVKDSKGKSLKKNTDYTVSYASGRKNVGRYYVKITFKGNYSGTVTKTFDIKPRTTSISKLTATSKGFKVYWKKQATQTTGYQIQYSTSSKFSNAKTVTVTKNSITSKSILKLTAKKKYYVRVRTYKAVKYGGKNVNIYSGWSGYKYVTTKK